MSEHNSLPLPDDVIDHLFYFVPTFYDLKHLVSASKGLNAVFNSHKQSIIRAVAYNITGPALPQVVRLIRFEAAVFEDINSFPETMQISPLMPSEIRAIEIISAAAKDLENIFSSRHKDRTSAESKLSDRESWRFKRAIYRIMLYSRVFPGSRFFGHESDDDVSVGDPFRLENEQKARKSFLEEFFLDELLEIYSATKFLEELAEWLAVDLEAGLYNTFAQIALSAGPLEINYSYQTAASNFGCNLQVFLDSLQGGEWDNTEMVEGYLSRPLSAIFDDSDIKPKAGDAHWSSILDDIHDDGGGDLCTQCNTAGGSNLLGKHNWDWMLGLMSTRHLPLRGCLDGNRTVATFLHDEMSAIGYSRSKLMDQLFDLKTAEYASWTKDDLLCEGCTAKFIKEHLYLWLMEKQREAGKIIPEDCWYGYHCRTQMHKTAHAQRLNHLCEPTRALIY